MPLQLYKIKLKSLIKLLKVDTGLKMNCLPSHIVPPLFEYWIETSPGLKGLLSSPTIIKQSDEQRVVCGADTQGLLMCQATTLVIHAHTSVF